METQNSINSNVGWLFYKKYFADNADVKEINKTICESKLSIICAVANNQAFCMETVYPGLLIGSGYQHNKNKEGNNGNDGESFKIGFFFDHTTGMPIIPGSSIKGILRSVFPQKSLGKNSNAKDEWLKNVLKEDLKINEEIDPDVLEREIFDGYDEQDKCYIPLYERDIFFDAVPVKGEKLFSSDYITPHINRECSKLSPFTNPVPIKFLKVLPNVQFEFRFKLEKSRRYKEITAEKKKQLFEQIIETLGIGSKTNVGYGRLKKVKQDNRRTVLLLHDDQINYDDDLKKNKEFKGEVYDKDDLYLYIRFCVKGKKNEVHKKINGRYCDIEKNSKVVIVINQDFKIDSERLDFAIKRL